MYKIVIISSGQPSANPRAVKEAILLSQNAFKVTFIYCPLSPWADEFDKILFADNTSIKWISAGYHAEKCKIGYYFARLRKKYWEFISKCTQNKLDCNIKSTVLFSQELLSEALKNKADLYIGHNLGAISAVVMAAEKYNAKVGFDAEDFHRGEYKASDAIGKLIGKIEETYYPLMDYCTVASPLIGEGYKKIFPNQSFIVINNVFSSKYINKASLEIEKKTVNLFWFSQFIGPKRGLETVLLALNMCDGLNIKLHLLGNISQSYKAYILETIKDNSKIFFIPPTSLQEIFTIGASFDIGLATELPETENREFCLTNKVFTYLLAGNALILSNTKAQSKLLNDNPNIGLLYNSENAHELSAAIKKLYNDRSLLLRMKQNSLKLAAVKFNWENEGNTFLQLIKDTINKK